MCCFVFMVVPTPRPYIVRPITPRVRPFTLIGSQVVWCGNGGSGSADGMEGSPDNTPDMTTPGLPPTVPSLLDTTNVDVIFVKLDGDVSHVIGLQFVIDDYVVVAWKLVETVKFGTMRVSNIDIQCRRISGQNSNDEKQINILRVRGPTELASQCHVALFLFLILESHQNGFRGGYCSSR